MQKIVYAFAVVGDDIQRTDLTKHAYSMAYITLFSLVPALAAVFTLIGFFNPIVGQEGTLLLKVKSLILKNLAAGTGDQVITYFENFLANLDLKKIGALQFGMMIVSLAFLLRQIELALNRVFQVSRSRNLITRFIYFWTFLTLGSLVASIGIGVLSNFKLGNMLPFLADQLGVIDTSTGLVGDILAACFPPAAIFGFFYMLYKLVPNCQVRAKDAFTGAIVATFVLTIASRSFGWILAVFFKSYPAIYGAMAALPAFLLWLFILWAITLLGAIVTWRVQQGIGQAEFLCVVEQVRQQTAVGLDARSLDSQARDLLTPYLVLFVIVENFHVNAEVGITGATIASRLHLSLDAVAKALVFLRQHNFIVGAIKENEIDPALLTSVPLFPTHPGDRINLKDIHQLVFGDFYAWLQGWRQNMTDTDADRLVQTLEKQLQSLPSEQNLLQLVSAAAPKIKVEHRNKVTS